jgi:lysophospholipase L1-like esterase
VTGTPWFLTIGDSITSGYTVDRARAGVNSGWPLVLQQELAARGQTWSLYDTACTGETTRSYSSGCRDPQVRGVLGGLSQHDAALAAITAHQADLRLIVVDLGSNDLLRALRRGAGPDAVAAVTADLGTALTAIVAELRRAAPGVPLLLTNFYNPVANLFPASETELAPINAGVAQIARSAGVTLVDFHATVNGGSPPEGAVCVLVDCAHLDVHPTIEGHRQLADTVLAAVPRR